MKAPFTGRAALWSAAVLRSFVRTPSEGRTRDFSGAAWVNLVCEQRRKSCGTPQHSKALRAGGFGAVLGVLWLACGTLWAQQTVPPGVNLFRPETLVKSTAEDAQTIQVPNAPAEEPRGLDSALMFQDGSQLRGELVALDEKEIVWKRPDLGEPLHLARALVRRVVMTEPTQEESPYVTRQPGSATPARRVYATLKLGGADWLSGEMLSADGQTFSVRLSKATQFAVPRAQTQWIGFAHQALPAHALSGQPIDLEGWLPGGGDTTGIEKKDGTLILNGTAFIGRNIMPPARFEVSFEVPADAEEGTRLWLQPFSPMPNCYGQGTVELQFSPKQIQRCIYIDKFERDSTPLAEDKAGAGKAVAYRIFYDGLRRHILVMRNGREVGDWSLAKKKDGNKKQDPSEAPEEEVGRMIRGICFDRQTGNSGVGAVLKFNQLKVQPWNGVIPSELMIEAQGDLLSLSNALPIEGKLEAVSKTALTFSGSEKPFGKDPAFLELVRPEKAPAALGDAEALLSFGVNGELSVAALKIENGRAHCRTGFSPDLDLASASLQVIAFSSVRPAGATPLPPSDVLVFKNSDQVRGKLLSASSKGIVRWRFESGQELDIQPVYVAGVRFASATAARPWTPAASVELRNGDRLRGTFDGLDTKALHLTHPRLGALALARERVFQFLPGATVGYREGASDPATWLKGVEVNGVVRAVGGQTLSPIAAWVYLDGKYILRGQANGASSNYEAVMLGAPVPEGLDHFEVRCTVTSTSGSDRPSFTIGAASVDGQSSVQASFNYGSVQLVLNNPKQRNGMNWKDIPLDRKVPEATTSYQVRMFVDSLVGTADIFLNGVFLVHTGQQPNDRLPGFGKRVSLGSYSRDRSPLIFSDLWIGPWNGEIPKTAGAPFTALSNGDVASAAVSEWRKERFILESELGVLELSRDSVQSVEFGGERASAKAAGRIWLTDGCALNLQGFEWSGGDLVAQSEALGEVRLPAEAIAELIFDPSPAQSRPGLLMKMPPLKKVAPAPDASPTLDAAPAGRQELLPPKNPA